MSRAARIAALAVGACGLLTLLPVPATASADGAAVALLAHAAAAARLTAYKGEQYVTTWTGSGAQSVLADVTHLPGQGTVVATRPTAASAGTRVYDADGDASADALELLAAHYDLVVGDGGRVAGRPATTVEARRPDGSVAGRFWIDRASGLLLRREVTDTRGRIVRASAYVDLTVGPAAAAGPMPAADESVPDPWSSSDRPDVLRRAGWSVPRQVAGLPLFQARATVMSGRPVVHLAYSDGLTTLSVFEQRGHLAGAMPGWQSTTVDGGRLWVRDGVPARGVFSGGGRVYTVVADAGPQAVRASVAALPHAKAHPGFFPRLWHGLGRVASWMDPF